MRNWRAATLLAVAALIVGIIIYDAGWARRDTSAAFAARFGKVPQLSFDQQYNRGVICGWFRFPSQGSSRFVYVSHYSSGEHPEGLRVSSDATYPATAQMLCQKR